MEIRRSLLSLFLFFCGLPLSVLQSSVCCLQAQRIVTMDEINAIKAKAQAEGLLTSQKLTHHPCDSITLLCTGEIVKQLGGGYTIDDVKPFLQQLQAPVGNQHLVFVYLKKSQLGSPSSTTISLSTPPAPALPSATEHTVQNPSPPSFEPMPSDLVQLLLRQPDAKTAEHTLQQLKAQGRIGDHGRITKDAVTDSLFILLFEGIPPYKPISILSPVTAGDVRLRHNITTQQPDSLSAHRGCGAFWIKLK